MGYSIEVDRETYKNEVLKKSYETPILVDFYATWCGPCQLLKPILEKLVQEYNFILAKVDIDREPELAGQYGVEGVPDVRIVTQGETIPGFVGALSEAQLREFLGRLNLKSALELGLEEAEIALASKNPQRAKEIFDELFARYPDNPRVVLAAAQFLLHVNLLDAAEEMLATIGADQSEDYARAQSLKTLVQFQRILQQPAESELDRAFAEAARLTLAEDYEGALQGFLEIVQKSRKYKDDGARKAMLAIFNLLGKDRLLTRKYQQELTFAIY